MRKNIGSDDDDDDDLSHPSPLLQTQRFSKTDNFGTKDFRATFTRPKHTDESNMKLNLKTIHDNDDDSLNDSDDDLNTKTARSTSSGTSSQLTPKPKERSFLKKDNEKPKIAQRRIDIDDDERNVFGQTTMKPSPRQRITTLHEDEANDQRFAQGFANEKKRQSPTDLFSTDQKFDSRRNSRKSSNDHIDKKRDDSDDEGIIVPSAKHNDFQKSRHTSINDDRSHSRKNSTRSKDGTDKSDNEDTDYQHSNRQSDRQDFKKPRSSVHDLAQTSPKDTDLNTNQHQLSSSRPSSASKKEVEPIRRSSYCEEQDVVIPPVTHQQSQSRPSSAKSNTSRHQTQSAIDNITSANIPPTLDPLTSNNEALAATLQPPLPPPRPSAQLPPRPRPNLNSTTSGGINKKQQFKVPNRYKEITSRVDNGRNPNSSIDLTASTQRALERELKSQTLQRPQTARVRTSSANNDNSKNSNGRQRRLSSSGYEHVKPRVNTNLSINFDEINTTQMRADSAQSIKDGVYLEWLKTKEEQRKQELEAQKLWEAEKVKQVNKTAIERRVQQNLQNLERWRHEKDEQIKMKKQEEIRLKREQEENAKREREQKKKDAKVGFEGWVAAKQDTDKEKLNESINKKTEIEKQQEEKQKKILEATKAYEEWNAKKAQHIKKKQDTQKLTREEQLKKLRENEETKFVSAQDAYEKWLKNKEQSEVDDQMNTQRRNSLSVKQQQQAPFLPGGSQKNTGKIPHVVW
ncbi:unnamed protein product [Adineta steineri]|uniref:Microtubule-associated protein 9 n=1 Tax=Adineta steineri TaxID=433720 RepID=A0A818TEX3_9BILA|nr:unnamed protein product [Adineta steineri]CAF3683733.1 unnamed protein product [Adineta steineri]